MRIETGVTRVVIVGRRWAVKLPRLHLFTPGSEYKSELGWFVRGWLANRSEWQQRRRVDVARPLLTIGHFAIVFPAATHIGSPRFQGPWGEPEDDRLRDEMKPSSWGWFGEWRIIDFDRSWDAEGRGLVGRLYWAHQERLGRKWAELPPGGNSELQPGGNSNGDDQ